MSNWRFSRKRLAELEARLEAIDEEQAALYSVGPRAEEIRFENAADRHTFDALTREMFRVTDERDRCAMVLWRRQRQSAGT